MVGVFEVADPDTEAIQRTLFDARVESLHTPSAPGPIPDPARSGSKAH
jgi:hypothetical protein